MKNYKVSVCGINVYIGKIEHQQKYNYCNSNQDVAHNRNIVLVLAKCA